MNAPVELLQRIMAWLWQTSLSATVLIGLVLLIQMVFQKWLSPQWRYALWLLVLARLMLPVVPSASFSVFNLGNVPETPFFTPKITDVALVKPAASPSPSVEGSRTVLVPNQQTHLAAARSPRSERSQPFIVTAAPYLWVIGAAGYLLVILTQQRRLASWVRRQTAVASPRLMALLERGRATLGSKQNVRIIETSCLRTPAVFGFRKPCLLLPRTMIESLSDPELRLVMLHELVHVKRRDVLLNWLLVVVQSLHWFNPAVWLALRRLRAERELVCDAVVLSHLTPAERHDYGRTLIKLLDYVSKPSPAPSLIPIINRKHEIQRRISMITRFKPTPRFITLASAALLLALAGFTFTGAAEKEAPPKSADGTKPPTGVDKQKEAYERGIKVLEEEWARQDQLVRRKQLEVDKLREKLQISNIEETPGFAQHSSEWEIANKRDLLRVEAEADYEQIKTLYSYLTNLTRVELKRALSTAAPDPLLNSLLEQQALQEQKLADVSENYDAKHPEVKRTKVVLTQIERQIQERLDGILEGMLAKSRSLKAKLDRLQEEVSKTKSMAIQNAIERRPYFQAKRDLETLHTVRDQLWLRIMQEKIDRAIPK